MRRLPLSLALTLMLSAVGASSALADAPEGAQKAPLYGPNAASSGFSCEAGVSPTPETFGFVVLNTPGNETTVRAKFALKHAAPNTEYSFFFVEQVTGSSCVPTFSEKNITTNAQGNATLHFTLPREATATSFWAGFSGILTGETIGTPAVELD
jgi:hypothetical protein